jgi:hypothetical protein
MRPVIELVPHVGVGALRFGMHRDEVRRIVGIAPHRGGRWVETFGPFGGATWFAVYDDAALVTEIGRHPSFDPVEIPPDARVGLSRTELWRIAGRPSVPRVPNDMFISNGAMLGAHYDDTFHVRELVVQGAYDAVLGGQHLLTEPADDVIERVPSALAPSGSERDRRCYPCFPSIGLRLWRDALPEDDPTDPRLRFFGGAGLELAAN